MSVVTLKPDTRLKVEVLKRYIYVKVIESSRLKVTAYRGYEIIDEIFKALTGKIGTREGYLLLPEGFRLLYEGYDDKALKMRVICDFIAGMTGRYVEFYARLVPENPQTIFKPF